MQKKLTTPKKETNTREDLIQARKSSMKKFNKDSEKSFEWLNENSRKFLAAGYLGDSVSAEQRIADIAERAEQLLEMPGFAEKFYHYMSEGYYSLASPVWSNFGKERGLPISCFGSHVDDDIGEKLAKTMLLFQCHNGILNFVNMMTKGGMLTHILEESFTEFGGILM